MITVPLGQVFFAPACLLKAKSYALKNFICARKPKGHSIYEMLLKVKQLLKRSFASNRRGPAIGNFSITFGKGDLFRPFVIPANAGMT